MKDMLSEQALDQRQEERDQRVVVAESDPPKSRDRRLQAVRRIDWRFLLPNPHLAQVAYLGPQGGSLLAALAEFSEAVTVVSSPHPGNSEGNPQPQPDLVVLHSPYPSSLQKASSLLAAGGFLYWEVDRRSLLRELQRKLRRAPWALTGPISAWKEVPGLVHFRHYTNLLERSGFDGIQANWHRPSFEACLEMIPLDNPHSLEYVFARGSEKRLGQLQFAAGRFLIKTGWLERLVPCLSFVAHKPAAMSAAR